MRRLIALLAAILLAFPALAQDYAEVSLPDPAKEEQALALMDAIRCVVCQGQPISGSNADLAADMRRVIREKIAAGESPAQVRAWLVSKYGDWVSFQPQVKPADPAAVAGAAAGADRRAVAAVAPDPDRQEALMGWLFTLGLAALTFLGLYLSKRCSRAALQIAGAAILLADRGLCLAGKPGMAGHPVTKANEAGK